MKTKQKLITPQWAAEKLANHNPRNRPWSAGHIERIARDINNNAFATTHQGIAFYPNGDLADGQHRLAAVVKANKPVMMMVTEDLPETHKLNGISVNTFELIDGGRKRGVGQMLQMAGFKNGNRQAAIVRVLVNLCARQAEFISITTPQTHKALHYIGGSCGVACEIASTNSLLKPSSGILAAIVFWHTVNRSAAEEFLSELCCITGAAKSPSRALAKWVRGHNVGGGNLAVAAAKASASAIFHAANGRNPDRIIASDSACDWLLNLNQSLCSKLADIVSR